MQQYRYVKQFSCLGAECEDTCCKGWGMQLDRVRKALYEKEAPELLGAVTTGEAEWIMRRDPTTDYCVKFDNGLCGIHASKGTTFLGDACHFFPRITRRFGEVDSMAATLSCPEIVRLTLYGDDPFALENVADERVPVEIKNYLPEGMRAEDALAVTEALIALAGDTSQPAERNLAKIISVAMSLQRFPQEKWAEVVPMAIKFSGGRLPEPEHSPDDVKNLFQILCALIFASKKTARPRLDETLAAMQRGINISVDWNTLQFSTDMDRSAAVQQRQDLWRRKAARKMEPVLRRWLQTQLAMASYPFAGFGRDLLERTVVLAVRFATVKLALMCHLDEKGAPPSPEVIVRVIQSLSRFLDHLADPEFSIAAYTEAGWFRESRLRALIGDS